MAKKEHVSETPATQFLRKHQAAFADHPYPYEEKGGTSVSARALGVDEHSVIKTLVMQDEAAKPLIVLMHGACAGTGWPAFRTRALSLPCVVRFKLNGGVSDYAARASLCHL